MPTIWYVAWIVMCFQGDCTRFESAPYYKNVSHEFCTKMLTYTFQTQVGPYYDKIIDFEKSSPDDIKIQHAGCDTTDRRPEDFDGKDWRIESDIPVDVIPDQNDLKWQQQQEHNIE